MKVRNLIFISFFTTLAVAGAFLRIPLPFMSITFQMFFALLAGIILGPVRGMIAMTVYLALGLIGLPVFSLGGGIGYILQPSFGFILGFIPGAYVSGITYSKLENKPYSKTLWAYFAGSMVIYALGIAYMFLILEFYLEKPGVSLTAIFISMLPYIGKDIILGLLAASMGRYVPLLRKLSAG